jgi:predicted esterase
MRYLVTILLMIFACAACTSGSAGPAADADAGAASRDGSAREDDGSLPVGADGGDASVVITPPDPTRDCPAPFDAPGAAPKAGDNGGYVVSGQTRSFHLVLPSSNATGPRPLLLAFHGTTENGAKFVTRASLTDFVAKGFIVVAPDAVGNGSYWPVWDAMRMPGTEGAPNKDLDLVDSLIKCTAAHFPIDPKRVYVAGHSAGGIFANRVLRSRSKTLAGGIVGSGVFDFTSAGSSDALDPMTVIVTWGGDNDTYSGTTPNGVRIPSFNFVEEASLASVYYEKQPSVAQAHCRGDDIGHKWLPNNGWFIDVLLAHPKGSGKALTLPPVPAGAPLTCATGAYVLPALPPIACPASATAGCQADCQFWADCAVDNRTLRLALADQLSALGFGDGTCTKCVSNCEAKATTSTDADALACFSKAKSSATCGPGLEGAMPLIQAVNTCCNGRVSAPLCGGVCAVLDTNPAAKAFFPTCQ